MRTTRVSAYRQLERRAAHRRDAVRDRFLAGESLAALARDYQTSRAKIEQWLRVAMTEQRRRRA